MSWVQIPLAAPNAFLFRSGSGVAFRHIFRFAPPPSVPRVSKPIVAASQTASAPANLFAGTSGWAYPSWKPGFYPEKHPSRAFLHYYASQLNAVEVNYTFRTLPAAAQLEGWLAATPPGFYFSFKAPQRITHFARLRECGAELEGFLEAIRPVEQAGRLGPLLFQLPPNFQADPDRLRRFLAEPSLRPGSRPRIAFEFRHASWFTDKTYALLREANAALCVADTDDLLTPDVVTADFRCYRLRRDGGYREDELAAHARKFAAAAGEGDVFAFYRHQAEPTGALNARVTLGHAASLSGPAPASKSSASEKPKSKRPASEKPASEKAEGAA